MFVIIFNSTTNIFRNCMLKDVNFTKINDFSQKLKKIII